MGCTKAIPFSNMLEKVSILKMSSLQFKERAQRPRGTLAGAIATLRLLGNIP
jgi:hypothetical protein